MEMKLVKHLGIAAATLAAIAVPMGTALGASPSVSLIALHSLHMGKAGQHYTFPDPGGGISIWSGWNTESTSNVFTGAETTFTVPSLNTSACGNHPVGVWTGLGGVNSGNFIQSGIGYDNPQPNVWSPWFEVFQNFSGTPPTPLPAYSGNTAAGIKSGNTVYSVTYYNANTKVASFEVLDKTTGGEWAVEVTNAGSLYDGTTADFEVEEPAWNGTNAATVKFSTFNMTGAEARTSKGWHTLGSELDSGTFIGGQDVVAQAGNIASNNTSFSQSFEHCN
jgi:hypothetical protein